MQLQSTVTGDAEDVAAARVVATLGLTAIDQQAGPPLASTPAEKDLALFLGFQGSAAGREMQAQLTRASKELAEAVGGHSPFGDQRSTVHHRIARQLLPNPGIWLLFRPLQGARLEAAPGVSMNWLPYAL